MGIGFMHTRQVVVENYGNIVGEEWNWWEGFFFFFLFLDLEVSLRKPLSELGLA